MQRTDAAMSQIVAGRFDRTLDADAALEALTLEGFARDEVDAFYVSPPGENALMPLGGDAPSSEGSRRGGMGAGIGAAIGLVAGLIAGALASFHAGERRHASLEHPVEPHGGRMIAVRVDRPGTVRSAAEILRQHNARDVGRAQGRWRNGWRDFDPRNPLAAV